MQAALLPLLLFCRTQTKPVYAVAHVVFKTHLILLKNIWLFSSQWYKKPDYNLFTPYVQHRRKNPTQPFYILHPKFIWQLWDIIQENTKEKIQPNPPSSGFIGRCIKDGPSRHVRLKKNKLNMYIALIESIHVYCLFLVLCTETLTSKSTQWELKTSWVNLMFCFLALYIHSMHTTYIKHIYIYTYLWEICIIPY